MSARWVAVRLDGSRTTFPSPEQCEEFSVRGPLAVAIDRDGTAFVATVVMPSGIDSFGTGPSGIAAVQDLVEVMRAEAKSLHARRDRLSPQLAAELATLERVLVQEGALATVYLVRSEGSRLEQAGLTRQDAMVLAKSLGQSK